VFVTVCGRYLFLPTGKDADRSSSTSYQYHSRRIPKPACLKEMDPVVNGDSAIFLLYTLQQLRFNSSFQGFLFPLTPLPFLGIYQIAGTRPLPNGFQPGCSHRAVAL